MKTTHFFNKLKITDLVTIPKINLIITHNFFQSDDEENYNQNHQHFSTNQGPRSFSIDQPDIFEAYTRNEQIRQPRNNPTSYNNNFQRKNPDNTQSYQPTQMHSEIPLPYYLEQHEITKSQLGKLFSNSSCRRITTNDYEAILNGWIINHIK